MDKILQHNFKSEKPVSIFTTQLIDPDMSSKIEEEIRKTGDKQDYKTNVKAYMTDWNMHDKPGFDILEKHIKEISVFLSKKYYNREIKPFLLTRIISLLLMALKKQYFKLTGLIHQTLEDHIFFLMREL